jgi:hypothetical protein
MIELLLTIMLPTTIDRRDTFLPLLDEIKRQIKENKYEDIVEVIINEDNKEISIGKKRQELLQAASGKWVVGIDSKSIGGAFHEDGPACDGDRGGVVFVQDGFNLRLGKG